MQRIKDPQGYRQRYHLQDEEEIPPVEVWGLEGLQRELVRPDEICFAKTAAQFFLNEITLDDYFDRLICHLEVGAVRHMADGARIEIDHYLRVDLIAGAVKSHMLDGSFAPLEASGMHMHGPRAYIAILRLQRTLTTWVVPDAAKLKRLCVLVYDIGSVEDLCREAAAAEAPLNTLPPRWVDILAVIAYARRYVAVLQHLATYPTPPTKSTFDLLGSIVLTSWLRGSTDFQHSADTAENRLVETRMWTALIRGGWIHHPLKKGARGVWPGLNALLCDWVHEPQLRSSPEVEELCRAYSQFGFMVGVGTLSQFLSPAKDWYKMDGVVGCDLRTATMLLSCFPLSRLVENEEGLGGLRLGGSAGLLLPLTQWDIQNSDRLTVMRMLLKQGCDPNDRIHDWGFGQLCAKQRDTALHLAAERGDGAMVDLLLEFGARKDATGHGGLGDTPAERARGQGHPELAERIEGYHYQTAMRGRAHVRAKQSQCTVQ